MAQVVPSNGDAPLPMKTDFIISDSEVVYFINFDVGKSNPQLAHLKYIETVYVEHLINTIDKLGFADKTMTLHPVGYASATGNSDKNLILSQARASAIGLAVKAAFDKKKSRSALAKNIEVLVAAVGNGDVKARAALGSKANTMPPYLIEKASSVARSVVLSFKAQHRVEPSDKVILCRQILNVSILPEKILGSEAIAKEIDKLKKKSAALGVLVPVLEMSISIFLDELGQALKNLTEDVLKALEFGAPEIFLILKEIEFLLPSDIGEVYEFKNAKGATAKYNYIGTKHRVVLDIFDVIAQLLAFLKWVKQIDKASQKFKNLSEAEKKRLAGGLANLEKLEEFFKKMERLSKVANNIIDKIFGKDGPARKIFGNDLVDKLLSAVAAEKLETATEFSQVEFRADGLFDINSFSGVARAEVREVVAQPTTVLLEFAAEKNISLLGFQAHVLLQRNWHFGILLAGFEISNGVLSKTI